MHRHFRNRREIEPNLGGAIEACDKEKTERLLHQWQDTYVHWDKGWRWWKLGHAFATVPPDLDNNAWQGAESTTDIWVGIWKKGGIHLTQATTSGSTVGHLERPHRLCLLASSGYPLGRKRAVSPRPQKMAGFLRTAVRAVATKNEVHVILFWFTVNWTSALCC